MTWKRLFVIITLFVTPMLFKPASASAQCNASRNAGFANVPELNREGRTERIADIKLTSSSQTDPDCWTSANAVIDIRYNAVLTVPALPSGATALDTNPTNFEIHDATGKLSLHVTTSLVAAPSGITETLIQITVLNGTDDKGAYVVLKNLRFDVTTLGDGAPVNAFVTTEACSCTNPPETLVQVGTVRKTVQKKRQAENVGRGYQNGVQPIGSGSPGHLVSQAEVEFESNRDWRHINPFRIATPVPSVSGDIGTTATDLIFDVEAIPSGVTVTFPKTFSVATDLGCTQGVFFSASSQTLSATGGSLVVVYSTTKATLTSFTFSFSTGSAASDTNCSLPYGESNMPVVGVQINSSSGVGTALIRVVMGPGQASAFAGDDTNPTAVPRYLRIVSSDELSRGIVQEPLHGGPTPFFVVSPTQTALLYPYVTDLVGYQTGIEVGNTGSDASIFGNPGQAGALDVWFFPTGSAPFLFTVPAGVGRGLDGSGLLQPGGVFADTLDDLLIKSGHSSLAGKFDGYLIMVGHFNFGHGTAFIFSPSGSGSLLPALTLGGDSARQGNLNKLPEVLDQ